MKLWMLQVGYEPLIIRAETELDARMIRARDAAKQGRSGYQVDKYLNTDDCSCEELVVEGEPEIIVDFEA